MADRPPAPTGLRLSLADGVDVGAGGQVLVGGSPPRLLRLSAAGAAHVSAWGAGEPIGSTAGERMLARRLLDAGIVHPDPDRSRTNLAVHVVVPVHDEPGILTVAAALANGRPVTVVDDGSTSPLGSHDGVTVLRRATAGGPGVARNDGLRAAAAAGAEFVAFIDADVDPDAGWVDRLLGHFADLNVAAVAPRVRPAIGTSTLERYEATFPSLDLGPQPGSVGPGRGVAYAPSAALVVRVAAFEDVGGFDPALRFGEDVDLVWRLVAAGHTVRYDPTVEVRHRARPDWGGWLRQRRDYGSSAPALAARHGDAVAPARAPIGVYATVGAVALAPLPVAAAVGVAEAVAADRRVRGSLGEHHQPALVRGGLVAAIRTTLAALLRAWLPLTLVALCFRRPRRRVPVLLMAAAAADVAESPALVGRVRATVLRLVDHAAFGVGVWRGLGGVGRDGLDAIRPAVSRPGVRAEPAPGDTVGA